jgi:hypothetical protein
MIFDNEAPTYPELEKLNPDFWRFELEVANEYEPTDVKSGIVNLFDLEGFVKKAMDIKSDYMFYLGSETTPPCLGKNFN